LDKKQAFLPVPQMPATQDLLIVVYNRYSQLLTLYLDMLWLALKVVA
jgi:hypothetical protein